MILCIIKNRYTYPERRNLAAPGGCEKAMDFPLCYENYAFDFYGTLADICTDENDPELWKKLSLFYGYYGARYTPSQLQEAYHRLVKSKEAEMESSGSLYSYEASPEIDLSQGFLALFLEKGASADECLAVHAGQFFRALSTRYLRLYDGSREMLEALRKMGKGVYLLSNAQAIFTRHEMELLDITGCFDGILLSSDWGMRKPDARFFGLLLQKFGLTPSHTLFIGNDSATDIAGAKKVGMPCFYIRSNISPQGDSGDGADYSMLSFTKWPRL